jgi:hypothetical protein
VTALCSVLIAISTMPPTHTASPAANQAWFLGAPWTKLLCFVWLIFQFLHHQQPKLMPQSLDYFKFDSTGDFIVGLVFLGTQLRRLERELGSRQFGEWLVWLMIMSGLLKWTFQILLATPDAPQKLSTLLIAASLYWYTFYTPRLYPNFISLGGIRLSEKALTQLWALYLLAHTSPKHNFGIICSGGIASALYFALGYQFDIVPDSLVNILPWQGIANLLLLDPSPKVYAPLLMQQQQQEQRAGAQQRRPQVLARRGGVIATEEVVAGASTRNVPPQPAAPTPQEAIDQLTAMGFEEESVRQALQQANNNVERAADRLLMG